MKPVERILLVLLAVAVLGIFTMLPNDKTPTVTPATVPYPSGLTENFVRSQRVAQILGAQMDIRIAANGCEKDNNPATIPMYVGESYCYYWQAFDLPVPDYAYDEANETSWFVVAYMIDDTVDYYITKTSTNDDRLNKGPAGFANYISEAQYFALKTAGTPEY